MHMKLVGTALALAGGVFLTAPAAPAAAVTLTFVTCFKPAADIGTGQDGTSPRWEIHCLGGSTAPNISHFSYRISTDPTVAQLLAHVFGDLVLAGGPPNSIVVATNLSDTSGNAWGCGSSNCRIIAGFEGY